ncbi:MAG: amidohydrolase family protein [Bacteroidota bacterium]
MKKITTLFFVLCCVGMLSAQQTFPRNGVYDQREGHYAFTNATIHPQPGRQLLQATLIIREGRIEAMGTGISIPDGAVVIDLEGRHVYPSFIDLYAEYGVPAAASIKPRDRGKPQPLSNKRGAYSWNEALRSEMATQDHFKVDKKVAAEWRQLGFGALLTHQMSGISRGAASLVLTGEEREHESLIRGRAAHVLSFRKGKSTQSYPSSLMGCIALLRQTYLDAEWYRRSESSEERNLSLAAWNDLQSLPQIFAVDDKQEALRAARLGQEFGINYILKGKGDEYQRISELQATGSAFILPLNFPKAFEVEDPYDALQADLADLKHWELAPENPARLAAAGIDFSLTVYGHKKKKDFLTHLRQAVKAGLSADAALAALTINPARLLGVEEEVGSLGVGKRANFFVCDKLFFTEKATLYQHWVNGKAYPIKDWNDRLTTGSYELRVDTQSFVLRVSGNPEKPTVKLAYPDSSTIKAKVKMAQGLLTLSFVPKGQSGKIALSGSAVDGQWSGKGLLADGTWVSWQAERTGAATDTSGKKDNKPGPKVEGTVTYPFMAYGWTEAPGAEEVLIQNATVWTNEAGGILTDTDVLFKNGKVAKVGQDLKAGKARIVDATGKHLTCGIIDEHSHIAISRGVNEGTQASSAEVRIGDVVNAEDINIYRQLAGGVTTAQLLHGSANPIGGQSALIKMRWGMEAEAMKFEGADGFIKFALGENVKQTNWGDGYVLRFPQTRMGVEQTFIDYFTRAVDYGEKVRSGVPYRRDLDLEAVLEIVESRRFITCHSYQQGEINMLMKVAERFGFRVNTFTHILEGYKIADKMREHGAGGSSFSDWWAYKYEVIDAIPHNGPIMHDQGVLVAFNSDDAEMARRLNQEAAKAVMYADMSEEEAWKFVTLNPAKLLHIDDRVGSIKVGKDADLVLWSDHPLSIYARAEKTWVDGRLYYDQERDRELRSEIQSERARLIQKMIDDESPGGKSGPPQRKFHHHYHCDDYDDEMR